MEKQLPSVFEILDMVFDRSDVRESTIIGVLEKCRQNSFLTDSEIESLAYRFGVCVRPVS